MMRCTAGVFAIGIATMLSADTVFAKDESASQPATQAASQPTLVLSPKAGDYLTEPQLVQAYRAGQFQMVVRETGRIRANPKVLAAMNEFNLLVLRAEAYLQLKNQGAAVAVFEQAAGMAPDGHKKALMEATAIVVKRAVGFRYVTYNADEDGRPAIAKGPVSKEGHLDPGPPVQIDLLVLRNRVAALKALYADDYVKAADAVRRVARMKTMPEVAPVFAWLDELATVETAVNGRQDATQELREKGAIGVQTLIETALDRMTKRLEELAALSKTMVEVPMASGQLGPISPLQSGGSILIRRMRGLQGTEADELEGMIETGKKMEAETSKIAERLHVEAKTFEREVKAGAKVEKSAQDILDSTTVYTTRNETLHYNRQN